MQRTRPAKRPKHVLRWVIICLLGIVIGVGGAYTVLMMKASGGDIRRAFDPPFRGKSFVRILVLGEDNTSKNRASGHGLSDTIMVAAIDTGNKTVRAVSVPRDTMIEIPSHGTQKINASFAFGGPELTQQMVQSLLGLDSIDYYVKTDIEGLTKIVDMVGGVGVDVEKNMHYVDRHGGLYIDLKKGYRHLDGKKALGYVRFRHDKLGDITRTQRQQKFLRALARQMLMPQNWAKLPRIINEIKSKGYIETNMQPRDLLTLARLAGDVPAEEVQTQTLPGAPERIRGISYWQIDHEKTAEIVGDMLDYPTAKAATVEVLNGTGIAGRAKIVADKLETSGFKIASTGNAPSFDYDSCSIIVHNPKAAGVDSIAEMLGCREVKTEPAAHGASAPDITVIIGRDYQP